MSVASHEDLSMDRDLLATVLDIAGALVVVLAASSHPLCGEKGITPERLALEPFIMREPGSGTRQATERFFAEHSIRPTTRMILGSDETIKQAVAAGLGLAVLSRHVLALDSPSGALRELDAEGFPILRHWNIVHLVGKRLSPLARAFLSELKQARG